MSSRRFTGHCALLLFACVAPLALAQSPQLPRPLLLTVQPATYLPIEFVPGPGTPPPEEVDRLEKTRRGPAPPGLLELLDTLGEVPQVAPVRQQANRLVADLLQPVAFVRMLLRDGRFKLSFSKGTDGRYSLELSLSYPADWRELLGWYVWAVRQKLQQLQTESGQKQLAQLYLQAAHRALEAGQTDKAAVLVQLAHAWRPAVVEADPLAYKLHLHGGGQTGLSGEEAAEPSRLPIHPRQYSSTLMRLRAWAGEVLQSEQLQIARRLMRSSLSASVVPLMAPTDWENGQVTMGLTVTGRPTLTLLIRCPETGGNWVVQVSPGMLPVVWMLPQH